MADVLPRGVGDLHRLPGRVDVDGHGTTGTTIGGAGLDAVAVDQLALGRGDGDGLSAILDVDLARVEPGTDVRVARCERECRCSARAIHHCDDGNDREERCPEDSAHAEPPFRCSCSIEWSLRIQRFTQNRMLSITLS